MCLFKIHAKEIQDALETASAKAKARSYEECANIRSIERECEIAQTQDFYFNKMREAAEKGPVIGLLPVS